MTEAFTVRGATTGDQTSIERLLTDSGLTIAGVADHPSRFLVAEDGGAIVASAGLEIYGRDALLRSVAVRPDHQSRGLGRTLVLRLLERARSQGVQQVFLLTTTASEYFRRLGFETIADSAVDPAVRASKEFGDCCCAGARTMRLTLGGTP